VLIGQLGFTALLSEFLVWITVGWMFTASAVVNSCDSSLVLFVRIQVYQIWKDYEIIMFKIKYQFMFLRDVMYCMSHCSYVNLLQLLEQVVRVRACIHRSSASRLAGVHMHWMQIVPYHYWK